MIYLHYILIAVGSYLLGSISFSIMMSKLFLGGDVRSSGSGNAGATNMARVYGLVPGILTLLGDMLKAGVCMYIGWRLIGDVGLSLAGLFCLIGHCFPMIYGFHGGKGVSVGAIIALAVDWRVFMAVVLAFLLGAFFSRKVSFGSICACVMITTAAAVCKVGAPKLILCIIGMCLVIFQHRENIKRIINGTEPDFKPAHRKRKQDI